MRSEFELHATQIGDWKKQVVNGIPSLFSGKKILVLEQEELTAPLYQQISQLMVKLDFLKIDYGRIHRSVAGEKKKDD